MENNITTYGKPINPLWLFDKNTSYLDSEEIKPTSVYSDLADVFGDQAKGAMIYGEVAGIAKICQDVAKGESKKVIDELLNTTKDYFDTYGTCELVKTICTQYPTLEANTGSLTREIKYADVCFLGARIAELNNDVETAKVFYERGYKIACNRTEAVRLDRFAAYENGVNALKIQEKHLLKYQKETKETSENTQKREESKPQGLIGKVMSYFN